MAELVYDIIELAAFDGVDLTAVMSLHQTPFAGDRWYATLTRNL